MKLSHSKIIRILAVAIIPLAVFFVSCNDEDENNPRGGGSPKELAVEILGEMNFSYNDKDSVRVDVNTTSDRWTVNTSRPQWVNITSKTTSYFYVKVQTNSTGAPRQDTIKVSAAGAEQQINILLFQNTYDFTFDITPDTVRFVAANPVKDTVLVNCDRQWEAELNWTDTENDPWYSFEIIDQQHLEITVLQNEDMNIARTGSITLTAEEVTKTIVIEQEQTLGEFDYEGWLGNYRASARTASGRLIEWETELSADVPDSSYMARLPLSTEPTGGYINFYILYIDRYLVLDNYTVLDFGQGSTVDYKLAIGYQREDSDNPTYLWPSGEQERRKYLYGTYDPQGRIVDFSSSYQFDEETSYPVFMVIPGFRTGSTTQDAQAITEFLYDFRMVRLE